MKSFLFALVVLLVISGYALAQQPVQDPTPKCATCDNCQCAAGSCPVQCPPAQSPTAHKLVDTRNRWPWQGPFRWTGAVGRWGLGIRPRYQPQR